MADKCYPAAQALIDRAMKLDPALAADIRAFAKSREYGLVFEHNRPEAMRLYGKPVNVGDAVNVLPSRGQAEDADSHAVWHVTKVHDGLVDLTGDDGATREGVLMSEVVPVAEYDQPIYAGLRETGRIERGGGTLGDPGDKPYHVVINGENYHALEALQFCYAGKVDCCYIDPPYNGEQKDWKYNNDYVDPNDAYKHSKWLAWMERRLRLAKILLNPEDSVLIVTIDEKEYLRLGLLLEQTFPGNDVQMISTLINPSGNTRGTRFSRTDEYIFVVYMGKARVLALPLGDAWVSGKGSGRKRLRWRPLRREGSHDTRQEREHSFFPVFVDCEKREVVGYGDELPLGQDWRDQESREGVISVWPIRTDGTDGCWQISGANLMAIKAKGYVRVGGDGENGMPVINYLAKGEQKKIESGQFTVLGYAEDGSIITDALDSETEFVPGSQWRIATHSARDYGSTLNGKIIGSRGFSYPKSLYAVEDTIRFFVADKPDALVVDFFAGSGTTAHAVMRLNHQDGGRRRCISVTNNEISVKEEERLTERGLRKGDPEWESIGICNYVTEPRIQAAIMGVRPDGQPIKGDYIADHSTIKRSTRRVVMADYLGVETMHYSGDDAKKKKKSLAAKKSAMTLLTSGKIAQNVLDDNPDFAIDEDCDVTVLFNDGKADDWLNALDGQDQVHTAYVVTDDKKLFNRVKKDLQKVLGPYEEIVPVPFSMSDGFDENAVFFDLTYEEPDLVELGGAFEHIAPLLWLRAGCRGRVIRHEVPAFDVADTYAVLFDYSSLNDLVEAISASNDVGTVFVVTDDEHRYTAAKRALPSRDVVRLYESYLRSFRIAAEGATA